MVFLQACDTNFVVASGVTLRKEAEVEKERLLDEP